MYTEKDFETVASLVRDDIPEADEIILFGSYARGIARDDSDMDIAVIVPRTIDRKQKLKLLTDLRWHAVRKGYNTDFLIKPRSEYQAELNLPTLYRTISIEGKRLWKR